MRARRTSLPSIPSTAPTRSDRAPLSARSIAVVAWLAILVPLGRTAGRATAPRADDERCHVATVRLEGPLSRAELAARRDASRGVTRIVADLRPGEVRTVRVPLEARPLDGRRAVVSVEPPPADGSEPVRFVAFEPERFFEMANMHWVAGDPEEAIRRVEQGGAVIVAKEFLVERDAYEVGDMFPITHKGETHKLEIVAAAPDEAGLVETLGRARHAAGRARAAGWQVTLTTRTSTGAPGSIAVASDRDLLEALALATPGPEVVDGAGAALVSDHRDGRLVLGPDGVR